MKQKWMTIPMAVCLLSACGSGEDTRQPLHSVTTIEAGNASRQIVKTFSGIVKEKAEVSLGFRTGGQIEKIHVKEGQRILSGQLLAQLDAADYQLALDASEARFVQQRDELERLKQLKASKSISANDYEKAESGFKQTEVELKSNRNQLKYTRLAAPADGYVQSVNKEEAEMVNAGTPVFQLLIDGPMEIEVALPEEVCRQRDRIASIRCKAAGREVPVRLLNILPKADAVQLYKALLLIEDREAGLPAGMNVEVDFHLQSASAEGTLALPVGAVFHAEGKDYVWVVGTDSTVTRREVGIGSIDGDGNLVIAAGLTGEEKIVKAGVHALTEGEKVKVLPRPAKTNVGGLL